MGTRIYVGNLSFRTTEDELRAAFGANGRAVARVAIVSDRDTGRSRGFAFVDMADEVGAQSAIAELDGAELDGRALRVNEAREREVAVGIGERPRGYGAGGFVGAAGRRGGVRKDERF